MQYPRGRILIFAKAARPGYAKTRLIPRLGEQGAARLQGVLMHRTLDMVTTGRLAPGQLWISGASVKERDVLWPDAPEDSRHTQSGADLGARMAYAFEQTLRVAGFGIVIGTDCPAMTHEYLAEACRALDEGSDAVLGPAEDGGYVLIGLRRCVAGLFDNIDWGSSQVLAQTRQRLDVLGWQCHELPCLWDVDRPVDLDRLFAWDPGLAAMLDPDNVSVRG